MRVNEHPRRPSRMQRQSIKSLWKKGEKEMLSSQRRDYPLSYVERYCPYCFSIKLAIDTESDLKLFQPTITMPKEILLHSVG